jgi:hypothetical protein
LDDGVTRNPAEDSGTPSQEIGYLESNCSLRPPRLAPDDDSTIGDRSSIPPRLPRLALDGARETRVADLSGGRSSKSALRGLQSGAGNIGDGCSSASMGLPQLEQDGGREPRVADLGGGRSLTSMRLPGLALDSGWERSVANTGGGRSLASTTLPRLAVDGGKETRVVDLERDPSFAAPKLLRLARLSE